MAVFPIWQDNFENTNRKYFRISGGVDPATQAADGLVFYNGAFPTAAGGDIHVSAIVAPRLRYGAPGFRTRTFYNVCDPQTFKVETSSDGTTWVNFTRDFGPDWSYEQRPFVSNTLRSDPINGHFNPLMTLFWSQWGTSPSSITTRTYKGSTWTTQSAVTATGTGGTYACALPVITNYEQLQQVEIKNSLGTLLWDKVCPCAPAALYYRNAYGGWDAFLIEGAFKRSVSLNRSTRKVFAPNNAAPYPWPRAEFNYVTERTVRWTWSTKGLNDTESAKFVKHLLASNDAWLHDFATDNIYPVIIETDATDVKTYKANGRRVSTYEVTCRLAEDRISQ